MPYSVVQRTCPSKSCYAKQIGAQGHVVISGLVLGCDTAAHRGCLDTEGQTVAIVASGLDITHS